MPGGAQVLRRWQLTKGASPRLGQPRPTVLQENGQYYPVTCCQGRINVQGLEVQIDENEEPNGLGVRGTVKVVS